MHLYLFLDDFLRLVSSIKFNAGTSMGIITVAWTPDCFRASISTAVRGWTNCPSFMSSFVASVSSVSTSSQGYPGQIYILLPSSSTAGGGITLIVLLTISYVSPYGWFSREPAGKEPYFPRFTTLLESNHLASERDDLNATYESASSL